MTSLPDLSQQITDTLLEVRAEIGELKCEMKTLRDNTRRVFLSEGNALISLQNLQVKEDFQQSADGKQRDKLLEYLIGWAVLIINSQKESLILQLNGQQKKLLGQTKITERLIQLAVQTIEVQRSIIENMV